MTAVERAVAPAVVRPRAHPATTVPAGPGTIRFAGVTKAYGPVRALDDVSVEIPSGSLTVVVGPSGCGKTTLLNVLAGLVPPTSGQLHIDDADVTHLAPGERDLGMVFQDYALYPHMSVERNIGFGLDLQRRHGDRSITRAVIAGRVREAAAMVGLQDLLKRMPNQLSGGQRQRVALARAVVRHPRVLLLDEPLSALDAQLRTSARGEIVRLHREIGSTVVLVTHDQHEALSMGTHMIVMESGRVVQAGTPRELYSNPVNVFVARFVGSPAMNLFAEDGQGSVGWRPSAGVVLEPGQPAVGQVFSGSVSYTEFNGDHQLVSAVDDIDVPFRVVCPVGRRLDPGDRVLVDVAPADLHRFNAAGVRE